MTIRPDSLIRLNNTDKLLTQLIIRNRGTKLTELEMNRETLQQTLKKIQNILMEYFKSLYSIKLESLKEMDEFLNSAKPPKLNPE